MIRVGIAGFGFMGRTHAAAYLRTGDAAITAIAEPSKDALSKPLKATVLADEAPATLDPASVGRVDDAEALLERDDVDAISICTPTPTHAGLAVKAIEAGKHVLIEKPLALSAAEARRVVEAAERAPGVIAMPAMCMRYWPTWVWLREAVRDGRYGRVLSATFTRLGTMPGWAEFYRDGRRSGGAILDLHVHDADFVRYCFGDPRSVRAVGYARVTEAIDHVVARYEFDDGPAIVEAEGGWAFADGFPFRMRYLVNFEEATASFDFPTLKVFPRGDGGEAFEPEVDAGDGYLHEIRAFLGAIRSGREPEAVRVRDGLEVVRLIEAERASVARGGEAVSFAPSARAEASS